jgi:predicted Rossmann fold nucleotide-binding protein DprA/Smf involved in DNA uptake
VTAAAITHDSQAILLLCSSLALPRTADAPRPLSRSEWNALARTIEQSSLRRPAALIGADREQLRATLGCPDDFLGRLCALLERGAQLAIELDRLANLGIWALTRVDGHYPKKLKHRLRMLAPPVLFGAGPAETLNRGGLAIVGSRDVDDAGAEVARTLGLRCAEADLVVFSGGARGVDRLAMSAALAAGGSSVAVLAESLEQTLKSRDTRDWVLSGRLTLVTPSHPAARFMVGNAMGRNKVIYALASWACVVSADVEEGGTWSGAVENLDADWVPLFVRADVDAPEGNRRLLQRGALPITLDDVSGNLASWLEQSTAHVAANAQQLSLVREVAPDFPRAASQTDVGRDLFVDAWPSLERYLAQPRSESDLASAFALEPAQVKAWLARAVREGKVVKLKSPVRFHAIVPDSGQTGLFDA